MTRETKIGLLVGLAFIIVIGILLSDHINSSTDPVRADMTSTYDKVQQSIGSPDSHPQSSAVVMTAAPVIPQNPVPTQHDQPQTTPGTTIVAVGPGGDPSQVPLPRSTPRLHPQVQPQPQPQTEDSAPQQQQPPAEANSNDIAVSDPGNAQQDNSNVPDRLRSVARDNGMDLVPVGTPPANNAPVGVHSENSRPATTVANSGMRQIKAEDGDTVSKMAAKYLGANTKANRQAIIAVNPSMGPDGHLVIAGRTYQIPVAAASAQQPKPAAPTTDERTPEPRREPATQRPAPPSAGVTYYTVKDNDSLWKIASEQLGSGPRWTEIRDLNSDILKGGESLHANMRLKLPAKSIAD